MRRQHNPRHTHERMVFAHRLAGEYVNSRAGYNTLLYSLRQIFFDDNAATSTVYKAHALFHLLHLFHGNHALGVRRQRHVYRNEIRLGDNVIERAYRHTQILGTVLVDIRVISDDIHIKGHGSFSHTGTDTAHTNNAQSLVPQFHAHVLLAIPLAFLHGFVGNGDITGHGQHHSHGMFGSGDGITAGRIDDDNALSSSCRDINIVHAHTGTADNLKFFCPVDDLCCYFRGRTHHQCVILGNDFQQFLCGNLVPYVNLKFLL